VVSEEEVLPEVKLPVSERCERCKRLIDKEHPSEVFRVREHRFIAYCEKCGAEVDCRKREPAYYLAADVCADCYTDLRDRDLL
jgi:hypothetical protein